MQEAAEPQHKQQNNNKKEQYCFPLVHVTGCHGEGVWAFFTKGASLVTSTEHLLRASHCIQHVLRLCASTTLCCWREVLLNLSCFKPLHLHAASRARRSFCCAVLKSQVRGTAESPSPWKNALNGDKSNEQLELVPNHSSNYGCRPVAE